MIDVLPQPVGAQHETSGTERPFQQALDRLNTLAAESRKSSDSIIAISGQIDGIRQKDLDQDRRLDVVERRQERQSFFPQRETPP